LSAISKIVFKMESACGNIEISRLIIMVDMSERRDEFANVCKKCLWKQADGFF